MKAFGEANAGIFTSPTAVEDDVVAKYGVHVIGRTEDIKERFYAISAERRIKHPAVVGDHRDGPQRIVHADLNTRIHAAASSRRVLPTD